MKLCKDNGCNIEKGEENDQFEEEFTEKKKTINKMFRQQDATKEVEANDSFAENAKRIRKSERA